MHIWNDAAVDPDEVALSGAVSAIGGDRFVTDMGEAVFRLVGVAHLAVYALDSASGPTLLLSHSADGSTTTLDCWDAYRRNVGARDELWDMLDGRLTGAHRSLFAMTEAADIRDLTHRAAIYGRHDLRGRLSFYLRDAEERLIACNVYRRTHESGFEDRSIERWFRLAPTLMASCIALADSCDEKRLRSRSRSWRGG